MKILFFLLIIFCSGCASQKCEPTIITKEVKVPVYQPLDIHEREIPKLPVNSLNQNSSPKDVAVAYDKTVVILLNEVKIYRELIKKIKESR